MKYIIAAILLFISCNAFAQQITYKNWQAEAKKDNRLLPEYGGAPRTKEQQAADDAYIKTAMEEMKVTSRREGSDQLVALGFKYYTAGDLRVAMYRFNQAWLLDPKNANVYTGFGTIYFTFNDLKKSLKYYNRGLALDANNPTLLTVKARSYLSMYESTGDTNAVYSVLPLLRKSYNVDPADANTIYMLSRYFIRMNDCDSSMKYYYECKKAGGQPISTQYERALKARCNIKN